MKACTLAIVTAVFLAGSDPAEAQTPDARPLMHGDVSGSVGVVSVNKSQLDTYNDWRHQAGFGLGAGWYWTRHLKTEIDASGTTDATAYSVAPVELATGQRVFVPSRMTFSTRRLGFTQQYQFGDNEWVHPFAGAGVEVVREETTRQDDPLFGYDPAARQSRPLQDAPRHPVRVEVRARAVLTVGLKAYLTRQTFFLSDVRVSFGRRAEDVHWRIGTGVDF